MNAITEAKNSANIEYKEETRNKIVAQRIARIAYYLVKQGRPDTDFPTLVYLHSRNGCDVGDINHSYRFPAEFLKHVAGVVQDKLKDFFSNKVTSNWSQTTS